MDFIRMVDGYMSLSRICSPISSGSPKPPSGLQLSVPPGGHSAPPRSAPRTCAGARALPGKPGSNWQPMPATSAWIPSADARSPTFSTMCWTVIAPAKSRPCSYMRQDQLRSQGGRNQRYGQADVRGRIARAGRRSGPAYSQPGWETFIFVGSDTAMTTRGRSDKVWSC